MIVRKIKPYKKSGSINRKVIKNAIKIVSEKRNISNLVTRGKRIRLKNKVTA